uniref:Uncharacterized protein n=1 Tax=Aegilops tauschii subsp. strangulata TaxID=200361 RepID=A0A453P7K9_AEGTS
MGQLWAVFLAVRSLSIGLLGVLGVWLCYLFQTEALGPPPAPPPETPDTSDNGNGDDKNGLSEVELRRLGGVVQAEVAAYDEEEALCPIRLDAMEPGRALRVLPATTVPSTGVRRSVAGHLAALPRVQHPGHAAGLADGGQDCYGC